MSSVAAETWLVIVVVSNLLVPHICYFFSCQFLPHFVSKVLTQAFMVAMLKCTTLCKVSGPLLGFGSCRRGPLEGSTAMLASQLVGGSK